MGEDHQVDRFGNFIVFMRHEHGIDVSYETICYWRNRFLIDWFNPFSNRRCNGSARFATVFEAKAQPY